MPANESYERKYGPTDAKTVRSSIGKIGKAHSDHAKKMKKIKAKQTPR